MRKTFSRIAAVGSMLMASFALLGVPQAAQAQTDVTARTYTTGLVVQNLSSSTATVTLNFYAEGSSTAAASVTGTIAANGSNTYSPLPTQVPSNFKGSAIISSDQPVAAVVNISSPNLAADFGGGSYTGFTVGAKKFYLPLLFRQYFNFTSFFSVQNIGDSPTKVTVTYVGVNGPTGNTATNPVTFTEEKTIQPNTSVEFNQNGVTGLGANFTGAATLTSDTEDVVAAVMQVSSNAAGQGQILGYGGFANGSTNPIMPIVQANRFGYFTGLNVQNVGTVATDVTIAYTPSGEGTACTETATVQPGAKVAFAQYAFQAGGRGTNAGTDTCADGVAFLGGGRVTVNSANQPLVAAVNQNNLSTTAPGNKGDTYGAFDPASATSAVVFPIIQDRFFGYFTGVNIVNAGTVATDINCVFTNTQVTASVTALAPGGVFTVVTTPGGASTNKPIGANYNGSGTCTATAAGAKIVGVGQQLKSSGAADTFFVYEGINK
jgi:hypothetical protein